MRRIISIFTLEGEANLLDSKLYILKSFLAVITAYAIAHNNSVLKLDMISVLFGLMLTLEPVTLTGVRNGLNQIYASSIGALSTAIILYCFGINIWTVAFSIAFTLYVGLKINWRGVSVVAIFTSIYMTQYVQNTVAGVPSIFLTFRLRIFALGVGVGIAILYNFLFSLFSYRNMIYKRITFLLGSTINSLSIILESVKVNDIHSLVKEGKNLPTVFNNIDWVYSQFEDIKKESDLKFKMMKLERKKIDNIQNIISMIRSITHLNYDLILLMTSKKFHLGTVSDREKVINSLQATIGSLKALEQAFHSKRKGNIKTIVKNYTHAPHINTNSETYNYYSRFIYDINEIGIQTNNIIEQRKKINF